MAAPERATSSSEAGPLENEEAGQVASPAASEELPLVACLLKQLLEDHNNWGQGLQPMRCRRGRFKQTVTHDNPTLDATRFTLQCVLLYHSFLIRGPRIMLRLILYWCSLFHLCLAKLSRTYPFRAMICEVPSHRHCLAQPGQLVSHIGSRRCTVLCNETHEDMYHIRDRLV